MNCENDKLGHELEWKARDSQLFNVHLQNEEINNREYPSDNRKNPTDLHYTTNVRKDHFRKKLTKLMITNALNK